MEFVQVKKSELVKYIDYVNELVKHHDDLEQAHKDLGVLAQMLIDEKKITLHVLMDYILDSNFTSEYSKGLQDAYNLMKNGKVNNG